MHLLCFPWMDKTASESPSPLDICVLKGVREPLASLTLCMPGEVPNNPDLGLKALLSTAAPLLEPPGSHLHFTASLLPETAQSPHFQVPGMTPLVFWHLHILDPALPPKPLLTP